MGDARRGKPYFTQSAMEILSERLEMLNEADMQKQCEFIEVSLDLMPGEEKKYRNQVYLVEKKECKKEIKREDIFENICVLKNRLINNAVWNEDRTEVSWYTLELSSFGQTAWDIRPMNMYLYDGLAGILLVLYALELFDSDKQISYMRKVLEWTFFRYTDACVNIPDKLQSKNTGAYNGESSIVYTYLVLYQLSGEGAYLDYAKRHTQILDKLIDEDKNCDILSGNAGAAQVLLKMYDMFHDSRYLDMAIRAVGVLEKSATGQKRGQWPGWPMETVGYLYRCPHCGRLPERKNMKSWRSKSGNMKNTCMMSESIIGQMYGQGKKEWMISERWPGVMAPEVCCSQD